MPEKLRVGDSIVVQVKRDKIGKKGAKLTTKIDCEEYIKNFQESENTKMPILLYDANKLHEKIYRNFYTKSTKKIYVNNKKICDELKALIYEKNQIKEENNLVECREGIDFIEEFGLLTEFQKAKQELIWLKSGGFIIIEKTQALTTIDVNSGKNTMEKDTIYKTNEEAAVEAAKQIRLKNIGGMIVIDFINMKNDEEKARIKALFSNETSKDRSKITIYDFTKLGLLELTRKRL